MSSPIRLILARHGRTQWNLERRFQGQSDVPLDDVGREQATVLAAQLRGHVQAVVASDLLRASETASIIATALEVPVLALDPELRERGYGIFEGLTREDCIAKHPLEWEARGTNPNFLVRGGEPPKDVMDRMHRALVRAVELFEGRYDSGLVIGHGGAMRMFLERLTGIAQKPFGNLEFYEVIHDAGTFTVNAHAERLRQR
jgi:broad specificity phosphatase PhoE